jgi:hypothetical protein
MHDRHAVKPSNNSLEALVLLPCPLGCTIPGVVSDGLRTKRDPLTVLFSERVDRDAALSITTPVVRVHWPALTEDEIRPLFHVIIRFADSFEVCSNQLVPEPLVHPPSSKAEEHC